MPMMHVAVLAGVFFVLVGYQLPLVSAGVCPYTYYWRSCTTTWCGSLLSGFRCTNCNTRSETRYRCCSRWGGSGCNTPYCISGLGRCPNGGTCVRPDYCNCNDHHYSPDCKPCTRISNCEIHVCNTATDQQCRKCNYDFGHQMKAYRPATSGGRINRKCEKLCSWRSDSRQCYPGTCTADTPASCRCAPGFNYPSSDCMSMTEKPFMGFCLAKVSDEQNEFVEADCHNTSSPTVYTNQNITTLTVNWTTIYEGPSQTEYPRPYYIDDYQVGVVDAKVDWSLKEVATNLIVEDGTINCNKIEGTTPDISRDRPQNHVDCDYGDDIATGIQHGHILTFKVKSLNGGFMKVKNYNYYGRVDPPQYYNGQTLVHEGSFTFDFVKPVHCAVEGDGGQACGDMLDRGPPITKNSTIVVRWSGWSDNLAGIHEYEVETFKLAPFGDVLGYRGQTPVSRQMLDGDARQTIVHAMGPGVYCVLLTAIDRAGNHRVARRFLTFDDVHVVEVSQHASEAMVVTSAAQNTSNVWITDLDSKITTAWPGHFYNEFHRTHKFLNAIEENSPPLDPAYEEQSGQPPATRSMEAVPHVHGVVRVDVLVQVDHEGGRSTADQPPAEAFTVLTDFQSEQWTTAVPRADGDSLRMWVRARDILGNTAVDWVLVHVDSSPAVVEDVWLTRDGRGQLAVHSSTDLWDMRLDFEAYDYHSGLHTLHWELHDMADPTVVHGQGNLAARTESPENCLPPSCYCIPKGPACFYSNYTIAPDFAKMLKPEGDHDFDYYFVITATNGAQLVSSVKYQITIDTSPPVAGTVHDGPGPADLDYQQSLLLRASWSGFLDRESGVAFYQYSFSDHCLGEEDFGIPPPYGINETEDTSAAYEAQSYGKYHVSVLAYNNALEPSRVICSDGVVVDATPPDVHSLEIENAFISDGLIKDPSDNVWFISKQNYRTLIGPSSQYCGHGVREELDLGPIPIKMFQDEREEKQFNKTFNCSTYGEAGMNTFLTKENHLSLTWQGSDRESGIQRYEVALGSSVSSEQDVMGYKDTAGHRHLTTYHPNLHAGQTVYVHVRATNRAGLQASMHMGPIIVKPAPPTFSPTLDLSVKVHNDVQYLYTNWSVDDYADDDISSGYLTGLDFKIVDVTHGSDLGPFLPLSPPIAASVPSSLCPWTSPPTCLAVPTSQLQWRVHGQHQYQVHLRVGSVSGLSRTVTSLTYTHYSGAPTGGLVIELPLEDPAEQGAAYDVDQQSSSSAMHVEWFGFHHTSEAVTYQVGLGSQQGQDDIVGFIDAGQEAGDYMFTGLALSPFQTVYTTVKASADGESSVVSSDGITILPANVTIDDFKVYDGELCPENHVYINRTLQHHDTQPPLEVCGKDRNYSTSTTAYSAFWEIPTNYQQYITHFKWGLEALEDNGTWSMFEPDKDIGHRMSHRDGQLLLARERKYRSKVQPCHMDGCFLPSYSNGLTIMADPPPPPRITLAEVKGQTMRVQWDAGDSDLSYSWSLVTTQRGGQVTRWTAVDTNSLVDADGTVTFEHEFTHPLEASQCLHITLRAMDLAGLYSSPGQRPLLGCTVDSVHRLVVSDAVGEWDEDTQTVRPIYLETNNHWPEPDAEFTRSGTQLSAVWPDLRHGWFSYKVVSSSAIERWAFRKPSADQELTYHTFHCASPEVITCGYTEANFVNVGGLHLADGARYHVCVAANATELEFETSRLPLPAVSACSDGVTADLTAPRPGTVWAGESGRHRHFQNDKSHLNIYWADFTDVEEFGRTQYHSGIKTYVVDIGTYPGGNDLVASKDVGLTNMAHLHGLDLKDGQAYYVTVTAIDHVGHKTSSTSESVIVDISKPEVLDKGIQTEVLYDPSVFLLANWAHLFQDQESGITSYEFCVGSHSGFCDVVPLTATAETVAEIELPEALDGHHYFVTVMASNGAGLRASVSFAAALVDTSPPLIEAVMETQEAGGGSDVDYQTSLSTLHLSFRGMHDPHSPMVSSWLAVGSCPGCEDVLQKSPVGILTNVSMPHLHLTPGATYFSSLTACNSAGRCSTATSDGVTPDATPPHAGRVRDGLGPGDQQYSRHRTRVSAHWIGTHDPDSGISRIELSAGSSPGSDDILGHHPVHGGTTAVVPLTEAGELQPGDKVYVTITVWNNAGLSSSATSDGFIVDTSPPAFTTTPQLDTSHGRLQPNTQVSISSVGVLWEVSDELSYIREQYVSLVPLDDSSHSDMPSVKLLGPASQHTFSNVSGALADGGRYRVTVTACDAASLCAESSTHNFLVDNSPPLAGAFAVATSHAAGHARHRPSWMTYTPAPSVRLAWLGFSDPHSAITYRLKVGTAAGKHDLLQAPVSGHVHTEEDPHEDEGHVQRAEVPLTRPLAANEHIYVSIWAENEAGLLSPALHGRFLTVPAGAPGSGSLALDRRCPTHSCAGHCTCAPHGERVCAPRGGEEARQCVDVTGDPDYAPITVLDLLQPSASHSEDAAFTHSQCVLLARALLSPGAGGSPRPPIMLEWSVALGGAAPGLGLLGDTEPVWRELPEVGDTAVFTVHSSHRTDLWLAPHISYTFRMRAWYDEVNYAEYSSNGIQTDSVPPEISRSRRVREVTLVSDPVDADFVAADEDIVVTWEHVFRDSQAAIAQFVVTLGTYPGGADVRIEVTNATATRLAWTTRGLLPGRRYYSAVTATNMAGLTSTAHGDGFTVDSTPPISGLVWDGLAAHDQDYSPRPSTLEVSITGFVDPESDIDHYVWCVGAVSEGDALACRSIGLRLRDSVELDAPLASGTTVYSTVYAVNGAGLRSLPVNSNGITIDTTPPQGASDIQYGHNLLLNPGFDQELTNGWITTGAVSKQTTTSNNNAFVVLQGESAIKQDVLTTAGNKYMVTFHARPGPSSAQTNYLAVKVPNHEQVLMVSKVKQQNDSATWIRHVVYFTAQPGSVSSTVAFSAHGRHSVIELDDVSVQAMTSRLHEDLDGSSSVLVQIQTHGNVSSIIATWMVQDPEAPIVKYMWAVGYVPGGTQIRDFESVHNADHARLDGLVLQHGARVYVTVIVHNAAGLTTKLTSDPVVVDITSPVVSRLVINGGVHYITEPEVTLNWSADDPETGIEKCLYALGRGGEGLYDVTPLTPALLNQSSVTISGLHISHGDSLTAHLLCHNGAGLVTTTHSHPVAMVTKPPDVHNARIAIVSASSTHFPSRGQHQSDNTSVVVGCTGVTDAAGIAQYQVRVRNLTTWLTLPARGSDLYTLVEQLQMTSSQYEVDVRVTSHAGLTSETVSSAFWVDTDPPKHTGCSLGVAWPQPWEMALDWTGCFWANSPLVYQVNIGTELGGFDFLPWTEVVSTRMTVSGADQSKLHHVTITAVNMAGLYTSHTHTVHYAPP